MLISPTRDSYGRKPSIVSFRASTHGPFLLSTTENEAGEGVAYLKSVRVAPYVTTKGFGLISNIQPLWWTGMVGPYYPGDKRNQTSFR